MRPSNKGKQNGGCRPSQTVQGRLLYCYVIGSVGVRRVSHRLAFEACRVGIAHALRVHTIPGHRPDFFVFHFSKEMERKKDIPPNAGRNVRSRISVGESFALEPSHIHTGVPFAHQYLGVPHFRSIVAGPQRA